MNFIASPEIVTAFALGGSLSFNPLEDSLVTNDGRKIKLLPPEIAPEVPEKGFVLAEDVYLPPSKNPEKVDVIIDPNSERLQKLEPFKPWDGNDFTNLLLMMKAKGKCTTDHISPAGPWLRLRGHLDRLSDNLLLGAVNAFTSDVGKSRNQFTNNVETCAKIAREYQKQNTSWVIVGDTNYGEGSSREHAAMTPRYLGCKLVIAKSFARIHETNLKKQGVLALKFEDENDYEKINEDDKISVVGLENFSEGSIVKCELQHSDGKSEIINLKHSYNSSQIEWFKAGSALNVLKNKKL